MAVVRAKATSRGRTLVASALAGMLRIGQIPVMRLRKGIVVRLCIYVPLLGYLSWRAYERSQAERHASGAVDLDSLPRQTITLGDGTSHEIIQITEEQAKTMFGAPPSAGNVNVSERPSPEPVTTSSIQGQER